MNALIERAMQAFNTGAWDEAKALCAERLRTDSQDADALLVLGYANAASGSAREAEPLLLGARQLAPSDPTFLLNLGTAYTLINFDQDARRAFEDALAIDPEFPPALCSLGDIQFQAGEWDIARAMFERALARRPGFARAIASLANLALLENKDREALTLATKAAELAPDLPGAHLVLAELALREGAAEEALSSAENVLAAWKANPQQKGQAVHIKAGALERLSRFEEAFGAFSASNENARSINSRLDPNDHPLSPLRLERLIEFVRAEDADAWPRSRTAGPRSDPVFLVGFPRSGTTLIGQILGAHPEIETLEENDSFTDAVFGLLAQEPLTSWRRLTSADVERLRDAYWQRVRQRLGRMPAKPVVVDKMPMNLILLPIIHLLFPGAKIVFAIRDPRDVIMSCFKQRFAINYATAHFLTLWDSTAYYDVAMRVAVATRNRLPLNVHELRYEALVTDFEATIGATLTFIGLPWNDSVSAYAESAKSTRIRTPSARAVTQPISQSPSGAWRNYAPQLAPHMATLQPWIEAFGYGGED